MNARQQAEAYRAAMYVDAGIDLEIKRDPQYPWAWAIYDHSRATKGPWIRRGIGGQVRAEAMAIALRAQQYAAMQPFNPTRLQAALGDLCRGDTECYVILTLGDGTEHRLTYTGGHQTRICCVTEALDIAGGSSQVVNRQYGVVGCKGCHEGPVGHFGSGMCRSGSLASGGTHAHCTCRACY